MPSERMIELWKDMLTTVPGWIILASMVIFFGFLGFKLLVGTFSERLLKEVVSKQHNEFCVRFDRLSTAIEGLERILRENLSMIIKGEG